MKLDTLLKKYRILLITAVLVLLILAAFESVRHNNFVDYDDQTYILLNHHILSGFTAESLAWAFTSGYASNWHPLTWLSHMIDIELFGLNPAGHHIHNVLLHLIASLLLFWILRNITGTLWPPAFVAMVFAIHPLRVESVTWAAERKDVLCAVFWMLTTAAYVGYARHGGILRYLLVVLCLCLGLMTKPMIVTLPIILLLLDIWPLQRLQNTFIQASQQTGRFLTASLLRLIAEKIPLLMLVAVSCMVTYRIQSREGTVNALNLSAFQQFANVFISYTAYLLKTIWPIGLAPLYPFPQEGWSIAQLALALAVLAAISTIAILMVRKYPWLLIGWLWYIISLVPVIGLVQIGSHAFADRYSYLPSIGILIMLAWTAGEFLACSPRQKYGLAVLSIIAAGVMILMTRTQISYWKDSLTLNLHTLAVTRNNSVVYNNISLALLDQNKDEEALFYLRKALEIRPDYYLAKTNMATILSKLERHDEALICIEQAIKIDPFAGLAYFIQGRILQDMGNFGAALNSYKKAVVLNPDDFRFSYDAGVLLAKQGRFQEAVSYFEICLKSNSTWTDAYRDMALAQQHLGQIDHALTNYRKAFYLNPKDPILCYRIGFCFQQIAHPRDAAYFYSLAVKNDPNSPSALDKLAWLQATSTVTELHNPAEALSNAQKAAQLTAFKDYRILNTLAAALAAASQFDNAVDTIQKAITLAQTAGDTAAVQDYSIKQYLYQNKQPFVEPAATITPTP